MTELTIYQPTYLVPTQQNHFQRIVAMVLDTVSAHSQRAYRRALNDFLTWYVETGQPTLNKAAVNAHVTALKAQGVTDSSINQRLAAIRKLANEAADNDLIDESTAQAISRVGNIKRQGKKLGNWLTRDQAIVMFNAPDPTTCKGLRDRAILATMLGCGLRREEIVELTIAHLQQREGRWVILDLQGKHNRIRTVPMASWIKALIDQWLAAAGLADGALFRRMRKGDTVLATGMTPQAIWKLVQVYAPVEQLAPHDLRRTFAKLSAKQGAPLVQIQKTLLHEKEQRIQELTQALNQSCRSFWQRLFGG